MTDPDTASPDDNAPKDKRRLHPVVTVFLCVVVLGAGVAGTYAIYFFEPTATRTESTRETAMLVDTVHAERDTFTPVIRAMGTVRPAQEVMLRPRISGRVVDLGDGFVPGGFVDRGDPLVFLDRADYENELDRRAADLEQAKADLELEMGRQEAARAEFEMLGENLPEEERALVLREPQLKTARARVDSAQAAYDMAELHLNRTEVAAPFDAHVLARHADVGSQVSPSEPLASLVGRHTYWIEATVPLSKLPRLGFPKGNRPGARVRIRNRTAWAAGQSREGRLFRLVGALAGQTRMARVLVEVDDPLAHESDDPALMIGAYVEVRIDGTPIEGCVRLSRELVRKNDTVWVMAAGKLDIRNVEVVFRDATHAYIRAGLDESDRVVATDLATVVDGARLRTEGDEDEGAEDLASEGTDGDDSGVDAAPGKANGGGA